MDFHRIQLVECQPVSGDECRVKTDARMADVFRKTASGSQSFLFVEDEAGCPVGVLSAEDVLKRITDPSPYAFTRWMDMPVEAALQSRFESPDIPAEPADDACFTKVSKDGRLIGVMTDDDVLVSWRSIRNALNHSQGDAVTNLPNRVKFDQHLDAECNRSRRCGHSVAVILLDLDHFKQINDRCGHAAGDNALNIIGTHVRKSLRSYDLVARFGGDEFAVICSGCRPGEIDIVIRRIREVVLRLQEDLTAPRPLPTISVGACVAHDLDDISNPAQIVEAADECLYAAKGAGRNCAWKIELIHGRSAKREFVRDAYSNVAVDNGIEPVSR